ncbi:MAG TPA: SCO family protein [Thermomicrobiaceae bacterium]|nr:SCO family protein [Thermomicrobiaceae bacterium]
MHALSIFSGTSPESRFPQPSRSIHRRALLLSLAGIAILLLSIGLAACGGSSDPKLSGTDLDKTPAPNFTLTDQRGQQVSLDQFRGKAVVLTFIYTHCPDVCPLIAEHLRATYAQLPAKTQQKVVMLAVTVDPARDNEAALEHFSQVHGLANNSDWHAMTGQPATLKQVWVDYHIDSSAMLTDMAVPMSGAHATMATPTPNANGTVDHTDAIFLIDKDGNERVLMHSTDSPQTIASNLKALAG